MINIFDVIVLGSTKKFVIIHFDSFSFDHSSFSPFSLHLKIANNYSPYLANMMMFVLWICRDCLLAGKIFPPEFPNTNFVPRGSGAVLIKR